MIKRSQTATIGLLGLTIVAGLASRRFAAHLPGILHKDPGDVLWDMAVYFLLAVLIPRARAVRLLASSFGIGCAVELFKLFDPPWLHAVRRSGAGGLVLGHAFSWSNIVCYGIGALLAFALDSLLSRPEPPGSAPSQSGEAGQ